MACGSEERAAEVTPVPNTSTEASTPTATAAPPTTSTSASESAAPPAAAGTTGPAPAEPGEEPSNPGGASAEDANPGGAGDEEPIRQPARFEVGSVSVTPASVTVAPFLAVELEVVNVDEGFHELRLIGADVAFTLQGGQTERRRLPGLKAGMYTLSVDGGRDSASLVVGDEAGP